MNALSDLFRNKYLWLLPDPGSTLGLTPGRIYLGCEDDERKLIAQGGLEDILTHRTKGDDGISDFQFPQILEGPSIVSHEKGQIQSENNTNIAVSFFKGLIKLITGSSVDISGNARKKKIAGIMYEITERNTKGVELADLRKALKNFDVKKEIKSEFVYHNYYIAYRVHYCKKLTLFSAELDSKDWKAEVDFEKVANFTLEFGNSDAQIQYLALTANATPFPFAVTYSLLVYSQFKDDGLKIQEVKSNQELVGYGLNPSKPKLTNFEDNYTPYAKIM